MIRISKLTTLLVLYVVLAANLLGSTLSAAPGRMDPPRLKWKGGTIRVAISNSLLQPNFNVKYDSDVQGALRRSFRAWENVADIQVVMEQSDRSAVSPSGPAGDGVSLITIAQTPENVMLFSRNPDAESAKTRVFFNSKGFITEADIVLNPFQQFSTDGTFGTFDLQSTLTHEIGHMLGLRHSCVLGSTMSDSLPKNGMFGTSDLSARSLASSDIASVRELYGYKADDEVCCTGVSGKMNAIAGKNSKVLKVWAEEAETGRVVAQTDTNADGTFRLGGLPENSYSLFWLSRDESGGAAGEIGTVKFDKSEPRTISEKVGNRISDVTLDLIGVNSRLADTSITLRPGRFYMVYLGGKNLDPSSVQIAFNSPYFELVPNTLAKQDLGESTSAISFLLSVSDQAEPGLYSINAAGRNGVRTSLIGALNVE
jgi:hypothetical protein